MSKYRYQDSELPIQLRATCIRCGTRCSGRGVFPASRVTPATGYDLKSFSRKGSYSGKSSVKGLVFSLLRPHLLLKRPQ